MYHIEYGQLEYGKTLIHYVNVILNQEYFPLRVKVYVFHPTMFSSR